MRERKQTPINRFILNHLQREIIGCAETASVLQFAERAFALRDVEALERAGAYLRRLPGVDQSGADRYYFALARVCSGNRARAVLESVVERGSDFYRSRALSALGNDDYRAGRIKEAKGFYLEALGVNEKAGDLLCAYYAQHNLAIVESAEGDHKKALGRLESIGPMMVEIGRALPAHYYDYLHGLAVEYHYSGAHTAAQECLARALASPYAAIYPEWTRTQGYINSRVSTRSLISIPSVKISARVTSNTLRALMSNDNVFRFPELKQPLKARSDTQFHLSEFIAKDVRLSETACEVLREFAKIFDARQPSFEALEGMPDLLNAHIDKVDGGVE